MDERLVSVIAKNLSRERAEYHRVELVHRAVDESFHQKAQTTKDTKECWNRFGHGRFFREN